MTLTHRRLLVCCCLILGVPACRENATQAGSSPAPSAVTTSTPLPPTSATSATSAPDAAPRPKLALVGRSEQPIALSPPGSQLLAIVSGVPYRIDAEGLHQEEAVVSGLRPLRNWRSLSVYGAFPEGAVMVAHPRPTTSEGACRNESVLRWGGERWLQQLELGPCEYTHGVAPWKDGRMLAATAAHMYWRDYKFVLALGKGPITFPAPTPAPPTDAGSEYDRCKTALLPGSLDGTPSGHLFMVGRRCNDEPQPERLVERWIPDARKSTLDPLPDGGSGEGRWVVRVRSEKEAYVASLGPKSSYIARFDGTSWAKLAAPGDSDLSDIVLDRAGGLWAAQGSRVHRLDPGGRWQGVDLPAVDGGVMRALQVSFAGDVLWVVAESGKSQYLFGPNAPREVAVFPSPNGLQFTEGDTTGPLPATAACPNLLVVLLRGAAPGNSFKPVAAKLAGKADLAGVEYVIDAAPIADQLAAVVPSMQVGNRIVELMMAGGSARPHFVCRKPKVKSTVTL